MLTCLFLELVLIFYLVICLLSNLAELILKSLFPPHSETSDVSAQICFLVFNLLDWLPICQPQIYTNHFLIKGCTLSPLSQLDFYPLPLDVHVV